MQFYGRTMGPRVSSNMRAYLMDEQRKDAKDQTPLQLMAERSLETAERLLERIQYLYAHFPSPELAEAVRQIEQWRDRLQHSDS